MDTTTDVTAALRHLTAAIDDGRLPAPYQIALGPNQILGRRQPITARGFAHRYTDLQQVLAGCPDRVILDQPEAGYDVTVFAHLDGDVLVEWSAYASDLPDSFPARTGVSHRSGGGNGSQTCGCGRTVTEWVTDTARHWCIDCSITNATTAAEVLA